MHPTSPGITPTGQFADGIHNFKIVVEDRAGNISHDFQLTVTVDTKAPTASFGLPTTASAIDGLLAASDSGVTTVPATYADRVTNVTTPTFWGRAEADSVVSLYFDKNGNGNDHFTPDPDIFSVRQQPSPSTATTASSTPWAIRWAIGKSAPHSI